MASIGLLLAKNNNTTQGRKFKANREELLSKEKNEQYGNMAHKVLLFAVSSFLWCNSRYMIKFKNSLPILITLQRIATSTAISTAISSVVFLERDIVTHRPEYQVGLYWLAAITQVALLNNGVKYILFPYFIHLYISGKSYIVQLIIRNVSIW